jgi:hypothetical protein
VIATRIVARVVRYETVTYMIDGVVDHSCAHDLITSGEYEPFDSDIDSEDVDIMSVETRTL